MANELRDAVRAAWRMFDDPSQPVAGTEHSPRKSEIFAFGDQLQTAFDALNASQEAGVIGAETWAALSGYSTSGRAVGDFAEVTGPDAGTHTDPVVGGAPVANEGRYRWSASPAGWKRIGDTTTKVIADAVADIEAAMEDAEDLAAAKNQIMALIYRADYAFKDGAQFTAAGGAAEYPPEAGKRMVWYDRDPEIEGDSRYFDGDGSSWVDGVILPFGRAIEKYDSSVLHAPFFKDYYAHWNSGTNGDGSYGGIRLNVETDGVTNYNSSSPFLDFRLNGDQQYNFGLGGAIQFGTSATQFAAVTYNGSAGLILGALPDTSGVAALATLTWASLDHVGSDPASIVEVYWGGGSSGRVHHIAQNAWVISAQGGRFEYEGFAARLSKVGYESASAIGKTIDFNDSGQTPTLANPIVSISTTNTSTPDTSKLLQFCTLSSGTWTEKGYITGAGRARFVKVEVSGDTLNIETHKTPASASATGTKGEWCHDANYIYVCTATNTWKRAALTSW